MCGACSHSVAKRFYIVLFFREIDVIFHFHGGFFLGKCWGFFINFFHELDFLLIYVCIYKFLYLCIFIKCTGGGKCLINFRGRRCRGKGVQKWGWGSVREGGMSDGIIT